MSTLAGISLFPLKSAVLFQKTFVSNMKIQRQTANKSPFKAVYPLINAHNLMIIICTVVKEICVIVVSNLKNNGHKIARNCYFRFAVSCSSETGKT